MVVEMDGVNDSFVVSLEEIFSEFTQYIERLIIKGQTGGQIKANLDAKLSALNIIGMLMGSAIPWILNRNKVNYAAMLLVQKDMLLDSLRV